MISNKLFFMLFPHIAPVTYNICNSVDLELIMRIKIIFFLVFTIFLCVVFMLIINSNNSDEKTTIETPLFLKTEKNIRNKNIACYFESSTSDSIELLNEKELHQSIKLGRHIFFLETSCSEKGKVTLNPRQACAIESAAKMNPKMSVYLFILSPANFSDNTMILINQLMTYDNINIRRVFMDEYVKNTPLEAWWASGVFETSQWPKEHMADVLRFLTLWKFPGIYFDLDVIVMSSLDHLTDFAGAEDSEVVAIGVLGFGSTPIGRKVVTEYLEGVANNFRGDIWRHNGPDIITKTNEMTKKNCAGFTVYPPPAFYPIYYNSWRRYFENANKDETMGIIRKALAIHVWNKLSYSKVIQVGDDVPYALIASQYCPKIYHNCGKIF